MLLQSTFDIFRLQRRPEGSITTSFNGSPSFTPFPTFSLRFLNRSQIRKQGAVYTYLLRNHDSNIIAYEGNLGVWNCIRQKVTLFSLPLADSTVHLIVVTKVDRLASSAECCFWPFGRNARGSDWNLSIKSTESRNPRSTTKTSFGASHLRRELSLL